MNKSKAVFIILAAILLIGVTVTVFMFIYEDNSDLASVTTDKTVATDNIGVVVVPTFDGNTCLSKEREEMLESNILLQIDRLKSGVPIEDDDGNYLTDENGELVYESSYVVDYIDMEANLAVIINHFADKGYSIEAIKQIQRYYFNYAWTFVKYDKDTLFEMLEMCFPANGTTPDALTEKAEEVFGQFRDDGFAFVFKEPDRVADIYVSVCDVKPWGETEVPSGKAHLCIFNELYSGDETERNLEGWLHKIINELSSHGYGEKDIIIAQLLYAGSLTEIEYSSGIIDNIRKCIDADKTQSVEDLELLVRDIFDVDIRENIALIDYLYGNTAYGNGGCR